jgi:hypothetical protein
MRFFEEKGHSLSIAPEPLAIWNKKLEGMLKKLNIPHEDMYPAAPEHLSRFFLIVNNSDRGSFVVFLGSRLCVKGCWWLN